MTDATRCAAGLHTRPPGATGPCPVCALPPAEYAARLARLRRAAADRSRARLGTKPRGVR